MADSHRVIDVRGIRVLKSAGYRYLSRRGTFNLSAGDGVIVNCITWTDSQGSRYSHRVGDHMATQPLADRQDIA